MSNRRQCNKLSLFLFYFSFVALSENSFSINTRFSDKLCYIPSHTIPVKTLEDFLTCQTLHEREMGPFPINVTILLKVSPGSQCVRIVSR